MTNELIEIPWALSRLTREKSLKQNSLTTASDTPALQRAKSFAVIDAAKIANLPEILANGTAAHKCLFYGNVLEDVGDASPWLVELKPSSYWTKALLSEPHSIVKYWSTQAWIVFEAQKSFAEVWSHLRKFTRVWIDDRPKQFFRFYDPQLYLGLQESDLETVCTYFDKLFSDVILKMHSPDASDDSIQTLERRNGAPVEGPRLAMRLRYEDIAPFLTKAIDRRFRNAASEMQQACEAKGRDIPSEQACIRLLLILRDEFGFAYWDDLVRVGSAVAVEQIFLAGKIRTRLAQAPFTSKSEQALFLWKTVVKGR